MQDANAQTFAVQTDAELDALYGEPVKPSITKEIDHVSDHYRAYIEASPFCVVATVGPDGTDCSPRGDPAPIVKVRDPHTLLLPDRRGNGRVDGLRNLIHDPRISLLFLIPGIGVTMRVNGRAHISKNPELIAQFDMNGKLPLTVVVTAVDRVYFQCPKALIRSRLWSAESHVDGTALPSTGTMLEALDANGLDGAQYDANYPARVKETIY